MLQWASRGAFGTRRGSGFGARSAAIHSESVFRQGLIAFALGTRAHVRLSVYDARGRLVRRLVDRRYDAGRWEVKWDRRDDSGHRLSAGVYMYRLESKDRRIERR